MAKLIYSMLMSHDGYVADWSGRFDWAEPDKEVHQFVNDLERGAGMYLYGRRMYQTMAGCETDRDFAAQSPYVREFAEIWQAAEKLVFSRTLEAASTAKTRIERSFDPQAIQVLKASSKRDILIGGPKLAAHAFKAGLVDQCHLFLAPIIVGGGKPALPDDVRLNLELDDQRRFGNGMIFFRYRVMA